MPKIKFFNFTLKASLYYVFTAFSVAVMLFTTGNHRNKTDFNELRCLFNIIFHT